MNRILLISEGKSHLMTSFREQLERLAYQVAVAPANIDMINAVRKPVSGVFVFTDEKVNEKRGAIVYLRDWAIENGVPIFAMGAQTDIEDLKTVIPGHLILLELERPLRVFISDTVKQIDELMRKNGGKKKILVVGGSVAKLRTIKGWLEEKYIVSLAKTCATAIKHLALNRPNLVLLDCERPVAGNKQVIGTIRSEQEFKEIPIISLTFKECEESEEGHEPDGYIAKKLDPAAIVAAIDDFFRKRMESI